MTGTIIPLHGDPHDQVNALLPWYVAGTLDEDDATRVESHLLTCQVCQSDLAAERRLKALLAGTAATEDAAKVDASLARLMADIDDAPRPRLDVIGQWRASPTWMHWAMAAQLLLLAGGGAWLGVAAISKPAPQYHALGARDQPRPGNAVVVFRPDATEGDIRLALRSGHARLVDGPTAADAYVLDIPAKDRDAALKTLRNKAVVVVAEPLDDGDAR